jgi:hypothetical protein
MFLLSVKEDLFIKENITITPMPSVGLGLKSRSAEENPSMSLYKA